MTNDITMQQKIKVISKLVDNGCDTEKKLAKLDMPSILNIKGISILDMNIIMKLQETTKSGKLFSYLANGNDEITRE
ncbi:MAG: hypothetical protein EOM18_12610 [Clostridia bacterium]|uniref:Uncharacterized protein n=1 Tax=Hespellia stercorisuis DSM 15480 TaxID=1121950 RepID=A0A1M6UVU9_9FIRM|nr:hypothetical protein [Hespellia stercorisuis]NCC44387.1 hypothetical protein [Clostridia bacterium]SHK73186.1 hypothetical protein SAMN02745243_03618 [Hespellia stercorisuis DSM 15480]